MQANRRANSPDHKGPPEVTRVVSLQPSDNHPQHTAAVRHDHGPDECAGVYMQPEEEDHSSDIQYEFGAMQHQREVEEP